LCLNKKQATRHDDEVKVFTVGFVLNHLGVAAGQENIAGVLEFVDRENSAGHVAEGGKVCLGRRS